MQRDHKAFIPTLLTGAAAVSAVRKQFVVEVAYKRTTGSSSVYSGRFYASDAFSAEAQARAFVIKYIRPAVIAGVVVLPTTS